MSTNVIVLTLLNCLWKALVCFCQIVHTDKHVNQDEYFHQNEHIFTLWCDAHLISHTPRHFITGVPRDDVACCGTNRGNKFMSSRNQFYEPNLFTAGNLTCYAYCIIGHQCLVTRIGLANILYQTCVIQLLPNKMCEDITMRYVYVHLHQHLHEDKWLWGPFYVHMHYQSNCEPLS